MSSSSMIMIAAASAKSASRRSLLPVSSSASRYFSSCPTLRASSTFAFGSNSSDNFRDSVLRTIQEDESIRNVMAYSLAMSSTSSTPASLSSSLPQAQRFPSLTPPLGTRMKEQLKISRNQLRHDDKSMSSSSSLSVSLPRTLSDALRPTSRAVVITEIQKPFRVVNVNKAWEGLCGYTHVESQGKSLGELIQGPETDVMAVTALMSQLLQGETATTVLTNYTKSGRKFLNRLTVGPLYNEETGKLTQFVGVLQEV